MMLNLQWLRSVPALLSEEERLLLYSLISGLRPQRYLEIGTYDGGSALIVRHAMERYFSESCRIVCVDPVDRVHATNKSRLADCTTFIIGHSPNVLLSPFLELQEKFDFIFVDGNHSKDHLAIELPVVWDILKSFGYMLLHDACNSEVAEALKSFKPQTQVDCGLLCATPVSVNGVLWGGMRLWKKSS